MSHIVISKLLCSYLRIHNITFYLEIDKVMRNSGGMKFEEMAKYLSFESVYLTLVLVIERFSLNSLWVASVWGCILPEAGSQRIVLYFSKLQYVGFFLFLPLSVRWWRRAQLRSGSLRFSLALWCLTLGGSLTPWYCSFLIYRAAALMMVL